VVGAAEDPISLLKMVFGFRFVLDVLVGFKDNSRETNANQLTAKAESALKLLTGLSAFPEEDTKLLASNMKTTSKEARSP
jgi:hypothetical protein